MHDPIRLSNPVQNALTPQQKELLSRWQKLDAANQDLNDLAGLALVLKQWGEELENSSSPEADGLAGTASIMSRQIGEAQWAVYEALESFRPLVMEALGSPEEIKPVKAA